jgi:hypothetical protein
VSSAVSIVQPVSVRELAMTIMKTLELCQELIIADFEEFIPWGSLQNPPLDLDKPRGRLIKRKTLLEAALTVGGGTMRNPLSKYMFTASDIRIILAHPVRNQLKARDVEQN